MSFTDEERTLHVALTALAADQPDGPVDRMQGVRRRHARHRINQSVAAAVAVAAVVVAVVVGSSVLTGGHGVDQPAKPGPVRSWQLHWPDYSTVASIGHGYRVDVATTNALKASALAHLARGPLAPIRDVKWLYAGTPRGTNTGWAVLEATVETPAQPRLLGLSTDDGGSTWAVSSGLAPPRSAPQIGFAHPADRTVLALARPGSTITGIDDLSSGYISLSQRDTDISAGVAVMHVSHPLAPDTLLVGERDYSTTFVVRFPDGTPGLGRPIAWEQAVYPSTGGPRAVRVAGETGDGAQGFGAVTSQVSGRFGIHLRCAGQPPITVTLTLPTGPPRTHLFRRCDGSDHSFVAGFVAAHQKVRFRISGDPTALVPFAFFLLTP